MVLRSHRRFLLLLTVLAALPLTAAAQVTYSRAEQFLDWNTNMLIAGNQVQPSWMKDGNRFWYRSKTTTGGEFVLVDPVSGTRAPLFDHVRLARAMTTAADTAFESHKLPFQTFRFTNDGDNETEIEFNANRRRFLCNIASYACTVGDTLPSEAPFVLSPDKRFQAFIHRNNLYVRSRNGRDSVQLTTDGVDYFSYGLSMPRPSEIQLNRVSARRPNLRWSPDSRKIAVIRADERYVAHHHYVQYTPQRTKHYSQPYALPGDTAVPHPYLYIVDVTSKSSVMAKIAPRANQLSIGGSVRDSAWAESSQVLHVSFYTRGSKSAYLGAVDATSGEFRVIARDTGKTYVEIANPQDPASFYVTRDLKDAFWFSERDGWGHLYRFDGTGTTSITSTDGDGGMSMAPQPRAQLSSGAFQIGQISYVDETAKQIYFTARGREPGAFLYYPRLYRMGYDGTGMTLLSQEDAHHTITFSPSGKYYVDTYSTLTTPAVTYVRSTDGRTNRKIEEADISRLKEIGWRPVQVFSVKARDGVTDIYGLLYLPPKIDSTKKYPIISHIYPGPQVGSVGQWNFKAGGEPYGLAELGFVVMQLDHLGTPMRSKAFHDNYYGFFGDNGLPDHITAIKQLAARHTFIDTDRVGIFGHSGGGFASTDAILRYPDFFKVAVSGAGNHDNRSYNIYWAEKYQGLLVRDTLRRSDNFETSANKTMARNLRGKLLLTHGDMDDNVHPSMTVQVVDELIKANKAFDMIWAPNRNHGLNEPYFIRRRWDYFVEHLMGAKPPENYEIKQPVEGAPGRPGAPDEYYRWDEEGFPYWKPFRLP
ncbi:MAG: DPP IV N-terminal domain-containing protein [Gemmatimonadota bacterium]